MAFLLLVPAAGELLQMGMVNAHASASRCAEGSVCKEKEDGEGGGHYNQSRVIAEYRAGGQLGSVLAGAIKYICVCPAMREGGGGGSADAAHYHRVPMALH